MILAAGRIMITKWSKHERPHTYRLTFLTSTQYEVLRDVFGYTEDAARNSREAIVDDFGNLHLIDRYTMIWNHINQEH